MSRPDVVLAGKFIKKLTRLRGGGSALPGLIVEKLDPNFLKRTLKDLPYGVAIISGTNGKTTTTKMAVELLESQGLKVFTNKTGSNFSRGVVAELLNNVTNSGKLQADIAVLELDEAHAMHFIDKVAPDYCLLLNVMRDQLDRFGEIDYTAKLLHRIAQRTTDTIVLNRDDPRLGSEKFRQDLNTKITTYGVSEDLLMKFPSDDNLRSDSAVEANDFTSQDTSLTALNNQEATIFFDNHQHTVTLRLRGLYNIQNSVGAVALVRAVLKDKLDVKKMLLSLEQVTPAFGRGETVMLNNQPIELVLVKNPAGFRLALNSFSPQNYATMIAINDNYADGRDMSWLWDVEFDSLRQAGVVAVTGSRAADMALRLKYEDVAVDKIEEDLKKALRVLLKNGDGQPKRIYCTYTAMLSLRRELSKITKVEEAIS